VWHVQAGHLLKMANGVAPALHLHFDQLPCSLAGHLVIGGRKVCHWPFHYWNDHLDTQTIISMRGRFRQPS
jgi:hypothetical protein